MTVNELIEMLKNYPGDMRVLVPGYEGGYNDSGLKTEEIVFNFSKNDAWYYGPHECVRFADANEGTKCLIVTSQGKGKVMAKTIELKLTEPELNYILNLVEDNIREGNYWGNREQFESRQSRVLEKITKISDELILRKVRSTNGMD